MSQNCLDLLLGIGDDEPIPVWLSAPAGTSLDHLRPALAAAVEGLDPRLHARLLTGPLYAGDRELAAHTPFGSPPLVHGARLRTSPLAAPAAAALALAVVEGPGAGAVHPLPLGRYVVGRDEDADIRLADVTASRHQLALTVGARGVTGSDLGASNAVRVDGHRLADGDPIRTGARIDVGAATLRIDPRAGSVTGRTDDTGRIPVAAEARTHRDPEPLTVDLPQPGSPPPATPFPLATLIVPAIAAAGLAWWMQSPVFLAMAALGPIAAAAQWWSSRRAGRRTARDAQRATARARAAVEREIHAEVARRVAARRARYPDPLTITDTAARRTAALWSRAPDDPDALLVRLGRHRAPVGVIRRDGPRVAEETAADVPAVLPLTGDGPIAFTSDRTTTLAAARCLVAQCLTLHSPRTLRVTVLTGTARQARDWGWLAWAPHAQRGTTCRVAALATDPDRVHALIEEISDSEGLELVVLDPGRGLLDHRGIQELLAAKRSGLAVISCSAQGLLTTGRRVHIDPLDGSTTVSDASGAVLSCTADLPAADWADRIAQALCPLRPVVTGASDVPDESVPFSTVAAVDPRAAAVVRHWEQSAHSCRVALGEGAGAPVDLDLDRDGPHLLIAGTTGAGKSELLQSLVAATALGGPPEDVSLLLIDYKGGSAFRDCAQLPHVIGVVTDLDDHLAERALTSLADEVKERMKVLDTHGCPDAHALWRRHPEVILPRLVIVVDELKMLVDELPDFVSGLAKIAAIGRSLGVHLVLATQRPTGTITPEIRANVSARICLRVATAMDSTDVLDSPVAAAIPASRPGRAYLRAGADAAIPVQIARITTPWRPPGSIHAQAVMPTTRLPDSTASATQTELDRYVRAIQRAERVRRRLGLSRGRPSAAWQPPLPAFLTAQDVPIAVPATAIAVGLLDEPAVRRQGVLRLDLHAGVALAVIGGPRSGRTTAVHTIAALAGGRLRCAGVQLHVIHQGAPQLAALEGHAGVGTIVAASQTAVVEALLMRLDDELADRQQRAAVSDASRPPTVLLVDGWDVLLSPATSPLTPAAVETAARLVRNGPAVGLSIVATGGRGVLSSSSGSAWTSRLCLRLDDPLDASIVGISHTLASRPKPPGRGFLDGGGVEVQLAWQVEPSACDHAECALRPGAEGVIRLRDLPRAIRLSALVNRPADPTPESAPGQDWHPLLGLGGDDASLVSISLTEPGCLLVTGPPGSGRSTTLFTLAAQAPPALSVVRWSPGGRSTAQELAPGDGIAEVVTLRQRLADPECLVLVDDADALTEEVDDLLADAVRAKQADGGGMARLVVSCRSEHAATRFRGVVGALRALGHAVVLAPRGPIDSEIVQVKLPVISPAPPGRGVLVHRGSVTRIQVARPD